MSRKGALSKRIANIRSPKVQAEVYKSEYQLKYKSHPCQPPRESFRPTVIRGASTVTYPDDMVSCTHRSFVPHKPKGPPRSYKPKKGEFSPPDVKMDTNTTYNVEFHKKVSKSRPPYKPESTMVVNKPFNTKTVYQANFIEFNPKDIQKAEVKRHPDNLGKEDKQAFVAQSTVQDSFRPPGKVNPAQSQKPEENTHIDPSQPFQSQTTHRAEFTPKTISARQPSIRPPSTNANASTHANAKPKTDAEQTTAATPKADTNRQKFDGLTVFQRDFVVHRVTVPEQSYKPKQTYRRNPAGFDGRTTHRMSYQPITIPPTRLRPNWANRARAVVLSKAQRARLDLLTSYQEAYRDPSALIPMERCRGVTYKVQNSQDGPGAGAGGDKKTAMESRTSYNTSYQSCGKAKRADSFKIACAYERPSLPFYGKSLSSVHYKGVPAPPAKSCKPQARPRSSPGKMSTWTTYRASYGRRPISCPPPSEASSPRPGKSASTSQTPTAPQNTAANSAANMRQN